MIPATVTYAETGYGEVVVTVTGAMSRSEIDAIVLRIRDVFEGPSLRDRYRALVEELRALDRRYREEVPCIDRPATLAHVLRVPFELRAVDCAAPSAAPDTSRRAAVLHVRACARERSTRLRRDHVRAIARGT